MQDKVKVVIAIVFVFSGLLAHAQTSGLFSPYDCREHAEETIIDSADAALSVALDSTILIAMEPEPVIKIDTTDGWQEWNAVENYSFGKDRGSLLMINDLDALHPFFRDRILELIQRCHAKGIELAVVETFRTHAKQHEYKTMGKKYTSSGAGRSKHQYGLAVDVVPLIDSMAVWDNAALWRKIGLVGEKLGLRWGGRWRKPYDPGHFEWTGGVTTATLSTGEFPAVPHQDDYYPCLDEDIKLLCKYWSEWETSQSSLTRK